MTIPAVDPGPELSARLDLTQEGQPNGFGIEVKAELSGSLAASDGLTLVTESIESYRMG